MYWCYVAATSISISIVYTILYYIWGKRLDCWLFLFLFPALVSVLYGHILSAAGLKRLMRGFKKSPRHGRKLSDGWQIDKGGDQAKLEWLQFAPVRRGRGMGGRNHEIWLALLDEISVLFY